MESKIKATLINPEEVKQLFDSWGDFSAVCYDSTSSHKRIGKNCLSSHHFSGSRWRYIAFYVENCPRFVIDQAVRHEQGVIKNVQSFRYVNKDNFTYAVPKEILDDDNLVAKYYYHMRETMRLYEQIQSYVQYKTKNSERANEQARYVLPMATNSAFSIAFTPEALIHYCNTRLCVRTEDKHRELAQALKEATIQILPELTEYLVPNCKNLLWCPEKKSCGAYPTKAKLKELINGSKN